MLPTKKIFEFFVILEKKYKYGTVVAFAVLEKNKYFR